MIPEHRLARAIQLIRKGPANADYFFAKLTSPEWIAPLAAHRVFESPYPARKAGDTISCPVWTPGEYLARMAAKPAAQEEIRQILEALPKSDNPRVYETIADAALAMSPHQAARLVAKIVEGLGLPFQLLLPEKAVDLLLRLNEAGYVTESTQLARSAFTVVPSDLPTDLDKDEAEAYLLARKARARIDDWQYGQLLGRCIPEVAQPNGLDFLDVFCSLLTIAVQEGRLHQERGSEDYSYIWRSTIEHPDRYAEDIRDYLVSAVRDLCGSIVDASPSSLPYLIGRLGAEQHRVFHRIVLFLLARHGKSHIEIVEEWFNGPTTWSDHGLQREFDELLKAHFGQLSAEAKRRYLEWVDQGPDMAGYANFWRSISGNEPSTEKLTNRREVWVRDRLGPIRAWLDSDRLRFFETLVERHGPYRPVERDVTAMAVAERSPLSDEEALSLDWQALVAKVRTWTPTDEFNGPTRVGLQGSLRMRVAANPAEAIKYLPLLRGVDVGYISAVLQALRQAAQHADGDTFDWPAILNFLATIVSGSQEADHQRAEGLRWLNKSAVSLVGEGLGNRGQRIPFVQREWAWGVLVVAAEDPDPTPEEEEKYGFRNMDQPTLSLNTVRGDAFHQVVRYALWCRRGLESRPDGAERIAAGFGELPEVKELLDRHLDIQIEPSSAVRAVYGQWFPWLHLLDPTWATDHVDEIFPEDAPSARFFWAAWGAYIVYTEAYTDVLDVLRSKYHRAIAALADDAEREIGWGKQSSERLATHLMSYYWRGELTLEVGDLIPSFFAVAKPHLRHHALESLGRGLWKADEAVPVEVTTRLQALWDWRVSFQAPSEELKAFGSWFGSGQCDAEWSIQRLQYLLKRGVLPDPSHVVLERLATIAATDPLSAVRCLDRMIDLAAGDWAMHGWRDEARTILEASLRTPDPEARETATRVIHRLGAMQFQAFRDLLKSVQTS